MIPSLGCTASKGGNIASTGIEREKATAKTSKHNMKNKKEPLVQTARSHQHRCSVLITYVLFFFSPSICTQQHQITFVLVPLSLVVVGYELDEPTSQAASWCFVGNMRNATHGATSHHQSSRRIPNDDLD